MRLRTSCLAASLALAALCNLITIAPAQGPDVPLEMGKMWPFENLPLDYLEGTYGWKPDQAWLDQVRLSYLKFGGGCSSAFVSPNGLILTNHHCARDEIEAATPEGQNWIRDGFVAGNQAAEVKLPLTVQQLVHTEDVTEAMNEGIAADTDETTIDQARSAHEAEILEAASERFPGHNLEVVKLYNGGMFQLYVHKVYDDIRLVVSPHLQTSHFGGDPDNFTYPRYGLDFTICRAYVDGKPADTAAHFFKWSRDGAKEGELVLTVGNPGSTGRLKTLAQMEFRRDLHYPLNLENIQSQMMQLEAQMASSEEAAQALKPQYLSLENSRKAFRGYLDGLNNPKVIAAKAAFEERFRAAIKADEKLQATYGDIHDKLAEASAERRVLFPRSIYHTWGPLSQILGGAFIARITDPTAPESTKERLSANLSQLPYSDGEAEIEAFAAMIQEAVRWLPADDPYLMSLKRYGSPLGAARRIVEQSKIKDAKFREELLKGGAQAVAASNDPAIVVGRELLPLILHNQKRSTELDAIERVQEARIGQAIFAIWGTNASPDATLTLRLSDGVVKGFPMNGTIAPWYTTFWSLYGRHAEFGGVYPFNLPEVWVQRRGRIDMDCPVDMVSTNDIIGGNSGSSLINVDREVVGLVFDGNIEMLSNRYIYQDDIPRTVSVHIRGITEALLKVYDAGWVVDELTSVHKR